jgi:hypothetical protein
MPTSPWFICSQCRVLIRASTNTRFPVAWRSLSSFEIGGTKNLGMKRYVLFVVLWVVAGLRTSAFAGVTVSAPISGSKVESPVQFVASATTTTCSKGVASVGVYTDNQLTNVTNGTSLNTSLQLSVGAHNTVVEEWDYCGGATFTSVPITVVNQTGLLVSSPANNSTVSSPVQFTATANTLTCSKGVASMGVYVNDKLTYVANGTSLNTALPLSPGTYNAVVEEWDYCGGATFIPLKITVSGAALSTGKIAASLPTVNLGAVPVGGTATLAETLTNVGQAPVMLSSANTNGSAFGRTGISPPLTLAPSESVTFNVFFKPTVGGAASGSLTVISNASNPTVSIPLSGTGQAAGILTVSPTSTNFGSVTIGTSKTIAASLSAASSSVVISSATTTSSEFTLSGATFPMTISAGKSASLTVKFVPQSSGAASGKLSFVSNAPNSPTVQGLTGTGVAASQHQVNLSWTASSSSVVGYNIYRGTNTGGPYSKINTSLDAGTSLSDSTVLAGQTYYYVVTAVNSRGEESAYSDETKAVIPSP